MSKILILIHAICCVLGLPAMAERTMEIRLLNVAGDAPSNMMLNRLVDDAGAQALDKIEVVVGSGGAIKIRQVSPYRYASEYNLNGEPSAFEMRELGLVGVGTIAHEQAGETQLRMDLSGLLLGVPRVCQMEGFQAVMPVFTAVSLASEELTVRPGEWNFVQRQVGEEVYYWAIRLNQMR